MMERWTNHFLAAVFGLVTILSSCVSVGVSHLKDERTIPRPEFCSLDYYWSLKDVKQPVEKLCKIKSIVPPYPWKEQVLLEALENALPQACKCGGDGIYLEAVGDKMVNVLAFRYQDDLKNNSSLDLETLKKRLGCHELRGEWDGKHCQLELKNKEEYSNPRSRGI